MSFPLRIILPLYLVAFFVVAFAWRSYLVWRRTGINPYVVGSTDKPIDFVESLYPVPLVLLLLTTIAFSFFPGIYGYASPIVWLDAPAVKIVGLVLMAGALIWTAVAQMHMGSSWRIGIDSENKTELVGKGLFRISRNPIFLGMRMALLGYFLALPSAVTLTAVALADVLMQVQVRLEEEFLTLTHGPEYTDYCESVRRWV